MKLQFKKLNQQTIVITGASSGIGLATARLAAKKGAKLVLAARNDDALRQLAEEIRGKGGQAIAVGTDVGSEEDVRRVSDEAVREFGGYDTWVNNAGVSIYGRCLDVSIDDMRKMFETNFWGVVYGSRIACEHFRKRGGTLINVGSEVSERAIPLQGIYSASKHAVKGWTDALRVELESEGLAISVSLIKPGAIDTPFPEHAQNYLPDQPKHAPPVYAPKAVAEAILHAATRPVRDLFVGGGARLVASMDQWAPRMTDKFLGKAVIPGTHSGEPPKGLDALHKAGDGMRERGNYPGMVRNSNYTRAVMHPVLAGVAVVGAGMLLTALLSSRGGEERDEERYEGYDEKREYAGTEREYASTEPEYADVERRRRRPELPDEPQY